MDLATFSRSEGWSLKSHELQYVFLPDYNQCFMKIMHNFPVMNRFDPVIFNKPDFIECLLILNPLLWNFCHQNLTSRMAHSCFNKFFPILDPINTFFAKILTDFDPFLTDFAENQWKSHGFGIWRVGRSDIPYAIIFMDN